MVSFVVPAERSHDTVLCVGLDLARLADLPDSVISESRRVAEYLTQQEERDQQQSRTNKLAVRRKALLRVSSCPRSQCADGRHIFPMTMPDISSRRNSDKPWITQLFLTRNWRPTWLVSRKTSWPYWKRRCSHVVCYDFRWLCL